MLLSGLPSCVTDTLVIQNRERFKGCMLPENWSALVQREILRNFRSSRTRYQTRKARTNLMENVSGEKGEPESHESEEGEPPRTVAKGKQLSYELRVAGSGF